MSSEIEDMDIGHLITSGDDVIEGRKYPQTAQRDHSDTDVAPHSPMAKGPKKLAKTLGVGFKPRKKPDIHLDLNLVKETQSEAKGKGLSGSTERLNEIERKVTETFGAQ